MAIWKSPPLGLIGVSSGWRLAFAWALQLRTKDSFPVASANSGDGRVVATTMCTHDSARQDSVQVSLTGASSAEEAKKEFDYELGQVDPKGVAKDFEGYTGAKEIGGSTVLMLRENKILQITIIRLGNKQDPLDVKYLGNLLAIAADRI